MKTFFSNTPKSEHLQHATSDSQPVPTFTDRASPVLSISKKEEEICQEETLSLKWQTWCRTKQEIGEAQAATMILKLDRSANSSMLRKQSRKQQDEHIHTTANNKQELPENLNPDARAYFTRHLSKVLAQSSVQTTSPLSSKASSTTTLIPGSNVSNVQENPPLLEDPCDIPIRLEEFPLTIQKPKPRPPARLVATSKILRPGSRVLETQEANPEYTASFISTNATIRNQRHKKRRLALDKTLPADDHLEDMPTKATAVMADSIPAPKRLCVTSKQDSPTETSFTNSDNAASFTEKAHKNQAVTQPRKQAPTKPPFRHVLLGNADISCQTTRMDCSDCNQVHIPHPQHCDDTQTDGVLSCIEMEYAWLCEESLHCLQGENVWWSFVYQHASHALQVHLRRHGTKDLIQMQVADAIKAKRSSIRALLLRGYRRPCMKKTIALYRLAIRQGCSFEQILERSAATTKKKALVNASNKLDGKKKPTMPPKSSLNAPSENHVNKITALPKVGVSKILTKNESEVAWLLEESLIQNSLDGIDYQYVLDHASPVLRAEIDRHKRRWLPRLVRLNNSNVKSEFEAERYRIHQLLWSGYRRPETKAVLPVGRVTKSEYKKQQNSRET